MRRDLPLELCDAIDDALELDPALRPTPKRAARRAGRGRGRARRRGRAGRAGDAAPGRAALHAGPPHRPDPAAAPPDRRRRRPCTARRSGRQSRPPSRCAAPGLLGRRATPRRAPGAIARRLGAGALAGGIVLGVLETLGPDPSFSAPAAAGAAALAVALLPRIAWLIVAAGLCGWLVSPEADRQGTALILAAAAAPDPAAAAARRPALVGPDPRAAARRRRRSAPCSSAWRPSRPTPWRRAGLGAAGFLWLALGELLTGKNLLFGIPDGALPRVEWQGSISAAASDALGPLLSGPALAPAVVWAGFAMLLPLVVRGRWLAARPARRRPVGGGPGGGPRGARRHAGRHDRARRGPRRGRGRDRGRAGGRRRVPDGSSGGGLAPRTGGVRDPGIGLP